MSQQSLPPLLTPKGMAPPVASEESMEVEEEVSHTHASHGESPMDCPICLANAPQQGPSVAGMLLKCGHKDWLIHNDCIVPWLSRSRAPTCPLCR